MEIDCWRCADFRALKEVETVESGAGILRASGPAGQRAGGGGKGSSKHAA